MPSFKAFFVLCSLSLLSLLQAQAAETVQSTDLVKLGTSLNEATGELKIARLRLERIAAVVASNAGSVSLSEVEIAKIDLETAERKLVLLKEILAIETDAAKQIVAALQKQQHGRDSVPSRDQLIRAEARLRILQAIAKVN